MTLVRVVWTIVVSLGAPKRTWAAFEPSDEEESVTKFLLQNHYRFNERIWFDSDSGMSEPAPVNTLCEEQRKPRPGSWVEICGERLGISPSPNGPLFFRGDTVFLIPASGVGLAIEDEGDWRTVELTIDGQIVLSVRFERDWELEYDPWSGESDEFFEWFRDILDKPQFRSLFTKESDCAWPEKSGPTTSRE